MAVVPQTNVQSILILPKKFDRPNLVVGYLCLSVCVCVCVNFALTAINRCRVDNDQPIRTIPSKTSLDPYF